MGEHQEEEEAGSDNWDRDWDESSAQDITTVLEEDPEDMARWLGQAAVKGSSETMRMALLSIAQAGMTFVQFPDLETAFSF